MIYCESVPDNELMLGLANSKRILLLGCSICANISYCIEKGMEMPMYNWLVNPIYVKKELKRLENLLRENDYNPSSLVLLSLCFLSNSSHKKILNKIKDVDTIITLSCEYGKKNIQDILENKKIICGMKVKGFMRTAVDRKGLNLIIDKDRLFINNKKYTDKVKSNTSD